MTGAHVPVNRDYWNGMAHDWVAGGERLWAGAPQWGIWGMPEADLRLLPVDMTGMDAIEVGCGTGYVSGWMARRGARVTGIDISAGQLATARRLAAEHGTDIAFVEGNAEDVPAPAGAFDFAISEYGAAIWCDPRVWLREAWRILRPGGRLVFLGNHPLALVCTPPNGAPCERQLHRPYRGMTRFDWTQVEIEPGGVEFGLTVADWFRLFAEIGFVVEGYDELYAPLEASGTPFSCSADWARDYPCEQVWRLARPA